MPQTAIRTLARSVFVLSGCAWLLARGAIENPGEGALAPGLPEDEPLVPADSAAFEAYMKAGLSTVDAFPGVLRLEDGSLPPLTQVAEPGTEGSFSDAPSFSTTNLQTDGVDETDRVKFDGSRLYVARPPVLEYRWPDPLPTPGPGGRVPPLVGTPIEPAPGLAFDARTAFFPSYPEVVVDEPARVVIYEARSDPASAEAVAELALEGAVEIHGLLLLPASAGQPPLLVARWYTSSRTAVPARASAAPRACPATRSAARASSGSARTATPSASSPGAGSRTA